MKCTECGNENPAEADFCMKCGTGDNTASQVPLLE